MAKWTGTPKMTDEEYSKKYPKEGEAEEWVDWVDGSSGYSVPETNKQKDKRQSVERQNKINIDRKKRKNNRAKLEKKIFKNDIERENYEYREMYRKAKKANSKNK